MPADLVFIYGTLKQGFPNHHLNQGTRVEGDFVTVQKYPLYLVGKRHSPWLLNSPGAGEQVFGELYRVDTKVLGALDILERIDRTDGYRRECIDVVDVQTDRRFSVYAYFHSPDQLTGEPVKSGPFDRYTLQQAGLYRGRPG